MLDYVCWGTGGGSAKTTAESAGKGSGPFTDAIPPGGALHRGVDEEGYDSPDRYTNATWTSQHCIGP